MLVCVNDRADGSACCAHKLSPDFYRALKTRVKAEFSDVRVSQTGCLGNCASGASITIQPDNVWLGEVTEDDIDEIIEIVRS